MTYRSATVHLVTPAGWDAARAAGIRTIVSLLNDDEVLATAPTAGVAPAVPAEMDHVRVPLDATKDTVLWESIRSDGLDGTPLYFTPLLERHPDRGADAVHAIAWAQPGGVLFHCGAGRDRTGLVAALLLTLAGVSPEAITEDYVESGAALRLLASAIGRPDEQPLVDHALGTHNHTVRSAMLETLTTLDVQDLLRRGGLHDDDLAAARARLLP